MQAGVFGRRFAARFAPATFVVGGRSVARRPSRDGAAVNRQAQAVVLLLLGGAVLRGQPHRHVPAVRQGGPAAVPDRGRRRCWSSPAAMTLWYDLRAAPRPARRTPPATTTARRPRPRPRRHGHHEPRVGWLLILPVLGLLLVAPPALGSYAAGAGRHRAVAASGSPTTRRCRDGDPARSACSTTPPGRSSTRAASLARTAGCSSPASSPRDPTGSRAGPDDPVLLRRRRPPDQGRLAGNAPVGPRRRHLGRGGRHVHRPRPARTRSTPRRIPSRHSSGARPSAGYADRPPPECRRSYDGVDPTAAARQAGSPRAGHRGRTSPVDADFRRRTGVSHWSDDSGCPGRRRLAVTTSLARWTQSRRRRDRNAGERATSPGPAAGAAGRRRPACRSSSRSC